MDKITLEEIARNRLNDIEHLISLIKNEKEEYMREALKYHIALNIGILQKLANGEFKKASLLTQELNRSIVATERFRIIHGTAPSATQVENPTVFDLWDHPN